jgi:LytR cell envelope-related transcriptional attenuator
MGRKTTLLIVGGVVVGVAVLAGVLLSLGGGSHNSPSSSTASSHLASSGGGARHSAHSGVAAPGETHVVVLNATEANGLAHRLAEHLRQGGYAQAAALEANPPSGRSTSVVEYTSGHHSEAQRIAQTLGVGETAPLESAIAPLVGSATVVVIAGADQAAQVGAGSSEAAGSTTGGESSSSATGAGGEASAAGGAGEAPASAGTGAPGEASSTP